MGGWGAGGQPVFRTRASLTKALQTSYFPEEISRVCLLSPPCALWEGSRNVLSVMLKTITVSPPSKNPAPPGDSRLRCQAEGSIISADHAASSSPGEPFHLLPKWPRQPPSSVNLSWGSPLSLSGSSSKPRQLLGTLLPVCCVLCTLG